MEESLTESTVLVDIAPFISSAHGTERAIATVGYSAHILHYALTHSRRLNRLALSALGRKVPSKSANSPASHPHLLALASLVSETRTSLRLLGLIPLWAWGSATYKSPPSDPLLRTIAYGQVISCVLFQLLENVAFLATKGVLSKRAVEKWGSLSKWSLWSVRAWLTHILLEFVKLAREHQLSSAERRKGAGTTDKGLGQSCKEEAKKISLKLRARNQKLVNSLAWLPLCLHWSVDGGIGVPASLVGVLSLTAGAWGIHDLWLAT
ncbi:peroxin 11C [Arthroderma uncinatum]|uniref:peroxin 11C n=1 Tax=Arthroderma uncinatum TaxID=74035 RepID=UPI00144A8E4E|nr:peroxin 11C [Arthroderma uncinatum]KAF3483356.1 peroxin 11C [Arthroderma uncinatum]